MVQCIHWECDNICLHKVKWKKRKILCVRILGEHRTILKKNGGKKKNRLLRSKNGETCYEIF